MTREEQIAWSAEEGHCISYLLLQIMSPWNLVACSKHLLSHLYTENKEPGNGFAVWFWLRAFQRVKLLARGVISENSFAAGESTSKLTHVAVSRRLRFLAMWAFPRICSRPDFPKTKSSERDRVYERGYNLAFRSAMLSFLPFPASHKN